MSGGSRSPGPGSGPHGDSNAEFHEQLRLQQQYGNGGGAEGWEGGAGTFMDTDGSEYEWDCERGAWFPRITEDFLAAYQANYGFNEEGVAEPGTASEKPEPGGKEVNKKPESWGKEVSKKPDPGGQKASAEQPGAQQKGEKRKVDQGWIDVEAQRNTSVYVSGLPPDMSLEEFIELMSKFGIIMRDPETEECKIKLYKDKDGNLKGDGLCCYLKKESVSLALKLMDETDVRGHRVRVEPAKFEMKGQYDASKKKKKSKDYRKKLLWQKKQLDWKPEKKLGEIRLRHQRVVVIKNMFHPKEIEEDALVLNEIREDLRVECEKFGQVKKVLIFDRHPDGVASVAFKEVEEADQCIQMLNGRWFAGRQIIAEAWDGQVDYQIEETVREREERLKSWSTYLDQDTSAVQSSDVQKLQHASSGVSEEVPAALEGKSSAQTSESKGSTMSSENTGTILPTEGKGTILPTEGKGTILPTEGEGTILPTEGKGTIMASEGKGTIMASENKGTILPTGDKGTIMASEGKGRSLPSENKGTYVPYENKGSVLLTEGKGTTMASESKGNSLPSESKGSILPSEGKDHVEDSRPRGKPDEAAEVQETEEEEKWNEDNLSTDSSMGGSDEEP